MTPFYVFLAFSAVLWLVQLAKNKKKSEKRESFAQGRSAEMTADEVRVKEISEILDRALKTKEVRKDVSTEGRENRENRESWQSRENRQNRQMTDIRKWAQGMALEDDEHDWLAREMREEAQAYRRVSEMFQMKMSHAANCQAEALRLEHEANCDAAALRRESV